MRPLRPLSLVRYWAAAGLSSTNPERTIEGQMIDVDLNRLGGIHWVLRTGGRLTGPERLRLWTAAAGDLAPYVVGRVRLLAGQTPPAARGIDVRAFKAPDSPLARLTEEACLGREGRLIARLAAIPFDRIEKRRFFSADVGARTAAQCNVEIQCGPENCAAQQSAGASGLNRIHDARGCPGIFAANVDVALFGSDGPRRNGHAFEDGNTLLFLRFTADAILRGADLGVADGVAVEVGGTLTLHFDSKRELTSYDLEETSEKDLEAERREYVTMVQGGMVHLASRNETVNPQRLVENGKTLYIQEDGMGIRRPHRIIID